jgi:hypothetical protein
LIKNEGFSTFEKAIVSVEIRSDEFASAQAIIHMKPQNPNTSILVKWGSVTNLRKNLRKSHGCPKFYTLENLRISLISRIS